MTGLHSRLVARLGAAVLAAAGLSACIGENFQHGYVVDERAVHQVKAGMGPEQVLQTLGTPSTVSTVGNKSWYYVSQNTRRRVAFLNESTQDQRVTAVYFNPGMKVERVALYGLQDGKVFDFISRTTPAGGGQQAFIGQMFKGLTKFDPINR